MNVSDTEIVMSIMQQGGFDMVKQPEAADIVLLNTCAIRDNAEQKVWKRLEMLNALNTKKNPKVVGVLGCMAERLKSKLLDSGLATVVAGPDAYRDLPNLINVATASSQADRQ